MAKVDGCSKWKCVIGSLVERSFDVYAGIVRHMMQLYLYMHRLRFWRAMQVMLSDERSSQLNKLASFK